jgi:hypothetical protein
MRRGENLLRSYLLEKRQKDYDPELTNLPRAVAASHAIP